jgi:hypothetical protein
MIYNLSHCGNACLSTHMQCSAHEKVTWGSKKKIPFTPRNLMPRGWLPYLTAVTPDCINQCVVKLRNDIWGVKVRRMAIVDELMESPLPLWKCANAKVCECKSVRVRVQNCYSVSASAKVCKSVSARESASGRRVGGGWPPSLHLFSTL